MNKLKKVLFYMIFILNFVVTFSSEDARIYMPKKTDPAKLKIGVTKLKTKELIFNFSQEKGVLYAKLPEIVNEKHDIYLSNTLDKIPAISKTNGRVNISNIEKKLKDNITHNSKIKYSIVEGDELNNIKEGEKYLVIDPKTVTEDIYIYVVEKDNYHIKEIYKGIFNIPTSLEEVHEVTTTYSTIHFNSNHPIGENGTLTFGNGAILYNGEDISSGNKPTVKLEGSGGFPKKLVLNEEEAKKYYEPKDYYPRVWIEINSVKSTEFLDFNPSNGIMATDFIKIKDKNGNECGEIQVLADQNNDYIQINFKDWDKFTEIEQDIKICYGKYYSKRYYETLHTDIFKLKIDKKTSMALIGSVGTVYIAYPHNLDDRKNHTISYSEKDGIALDKEKKKFIEFKGKFPKKLILSKNEIDLYQEQKIRIKTQKNIKKIKDYPIKTGKFEIDIPITGFFLSQIMDDNGISSVNNTPQESNLNIFTDETSDYLNFEISNYKPFELIDENIDIEYIAIEKTPTGVKEHILKIDRLNLLIDGREEILPEKRSGTLSIYDGKNTKNLVLFSENGVLKKENGDKGDFNIQSQATFYGDFPQKLVPNKDSNINWGEEQQVIIVDKATTTKPKTLNITKNGIFDSKWIRFIDFNNSNDNVGRMVIFTDDTSSSVKIKVGRFWFNDAGYDLDLEQGPINFTFLLKYQIRIGNEWFTKNVDSFNILIGTNFKPDGDGEINIQNPIVLYDYNGINPLRHNKRVHLSANQIETLSQDGQIFTKNTTLNGEQWTENCKNLEDYDWLDLRKHKVQISSYGSTYGEVIKHTNEYGKTKSSTFITLDGENQVMFSYDGGNKFLNFGVSKYNFRGGKGRVTIKHHPNSKDENGILKTKSYNIILPKFDGIHYVNQQYDIKPQSMYIKHYSFDQEKGTDKVTIPLGTVGFRNLDTRITNQSGGQGIEIRAIEDVYLESTSYKDNNGNPYRINGKLFFKENSKDINEGELRDGSKITRFKGENEKATSSMLYLALNNQEQIIPGGKYKIISKKTEKSPLEVGVVVNSNDSEFFKEITNLYLQLEDRRFVDTKLVFSNQNINTQTGNIIGSSNYEDVWIKLNKNNYPDGKIEKQYDGQNWGSVKGEVVDVPLKGPNGKELKTKIEVLDEDYKPYSNQEFFNSKSGGEITLGANKINLRYLPGTDYISFKLAPTRNDVPSYILQPEDKIFYIKYYDDNKKDAQGNIATNAYLFTQRIKVSFDEPKSIVDDTEIKILNPAMVVENSKENIGVLFINNNSSKGGEIRYSKDNSLLPDKEKWWSISNEPDYASIDSNTNLSITQSGELVTNKKNIYSLKENINIYLNLEEIKKNKTLAIGINDIKNYKGQKLESEFYLEWKNKNNSRTALSERTDKITLSIAPLDTTYYGMITSEKGVTPSQYSKINKIGTGELHQLKPIKNEEFVNIKLNTYFREYTRNRGILNLIDGAKDKNLYLIVDDNITITPKNSDDLNIIKGEIIFKGNSGNEKTKVEIKNNLNLKDIENYELIVRIPAKEYKKLKGKTEYEIYSSHGKNIFTIDFEDNNLLNSSVNKRLELDKPLNFSTTDDYFWIEEAILDFGQISINPSLPTNEIKEIVGTTEIKVHSQYDYKLNVPSTIDIKKIDSEGNFDEQHRLTVDTLNIKAISKEKTDEIETNDLKKHSLNGILKVPNHGVESGEYGGYIMIDVIIDN